MANFPWVFDHMECAFWDSMCLKRVAAAET
jgi:hypothetical protein